MKHSPSNASTPVVINAGEVAGGRAVLVDRPPKVLDDVLGAGLCLLLVFGVLAFGAVEDWAVFILEAGTAALLLVWVGKQVAASAVEFHGTPVFAPLALAALLVAAQWLFGTSAYGYATHAESLRFAAYAGLLFLAAQAFQGERQSRRLALALAVFGFLVAVFAVIQDAIPNGKFYWLRLPRIPGFMYGPYVNHNHYAGLMEMLTPIPLVLALGRSFHGGKRTLLAFAAIFMGATIFLAHSRGGAVAFALQMAFLGTFFLRQGRRHRTALQLGAVCLLILVLLLFLGYGGIAEQVSRLGAIRGDLEAGRWVIAKDSARMILARPLAGWGLGTFPFVYPSFRSFYSNEFVNHAHNDYLEFTVETGLPGLAAIVWFLVALYQGGLSRVDPWHSDFSAAIRLAALVGCTGIVVHSLLDFNLHIPANAALFFVL
ncbi:MAG: O-antigen ligase family protein, partial [Terriglobales bacterium]